MTEQTTNVMKLIIIILVALMCTTVTQAQMNTDNSYLRENYRNSKTAQKAAARKAARKARKENAKKEKGKKEKIAKEKTYYVKAKDGSITTKEKAADIAENMDVPYLSGAVPTTTEGIVCFEHSFEGGAATFDIIKDVAKEIIDSPQSAHEISRILQEGPDTLIATICEPIFFRKTKWETDSALIRYQYFAHMEGGTAKLRLWLIAYSYEEFGFGYKAEEWITDKYALTKDKMALRKGSGKFRKKTVDYVNELFARIEKRIK